MKWESTRGSCREYEGPEEETTDRNLGLTRNCWSSVGNLNSKFHNHIILLEAETDTSSISSIVVTGCHHNLMLDPAKHWMLLSHSRTNRFQEVPGLFEGYFLVKVTQYFIYLHILNIFAWNCLLYSSLKCI